MVSKMRQFLEAKETINVCLTYFAVLLGMRESSPKNPTGRCV